MRKLIKRLTHPFLKRILRWWYSKPRKYTYDEITVIVHPHVFPPHLTLSTKILLDFIKPMNLKNKNFLELGCGCGIISLLASKKGAIVTATDINEKALEYLEKASKKNELQVEALYSNLFANLKERYFDVVVINPPYYSKTPKNIKESAWFCGENFEYFKELFSQLPLYISSDNKIYMILSEDCDIKAVTHIATDNKMSLETIHEQKVMGEKNYIYQIIKN